MGRGASLAAVAALALGVLLHPAAPAEAAASLNLPTETGSEWRVLAGYNTATHSVADANDPYALDLVRSDASTAGSIVYAPFSGTVQYADTKCVGVRDAQGVSVLLCHPYPDANLRGRAIARGQRLGVVAPDGEAGNNGAAHIHIALTAPNRGGPLPFSGRFALEGVDLPPTAEPGAYTDVAFRSSLRRAPSVDAGVDRTVRLRDGVTLTGLVDNPEQSAVTLTWAQTSGAAVVLTGASTASAQFTAPATTSTLAFRFTVTELATGEQFSDTLTVRVSSTAPIASTPPPTATSGGSGRLLSGSVPASGGFGLFVFAGGTNEEMLAATGCPGTSAAYWALTNGAFTVFIPGTRIAAVNAEWSRLFASGIPAGTVLLGRCR
ncbi:MAG: hypothetical protein WC211_00260 [Dehalococcoidia bacterium]